MAVQWKHTACAWIRMLMLKIGCLYSEDLNLRGQSIWPNPGVCAAAPRIQFYLKVNFNISQLIRSKIVHTAATLRVVHISDKSLVRQTLPNSQPLSLDRATPYDLLVSMEPPASANMQVSGCCVVPLFVSAAQLHASKGRLAVALYILLPLHRVWGVSSLCTVVVVYSILLLVVGCTTSCPCEWVSDREWGPRARTRMCWATRGCVRISCTRVWILFTAQCGSVSYH